MNRHVAAQKSWKLFLLPVVGLTIFIGLWFSWTTLSAAIRQTEIVSIGNGGVPGDGSSFFISLSADGDVATFESFSTNWAPDQTVLNFADIFVHDRNSNGTVKVTVGHNGQPTDEKSVDPWVSADGRYVSFFSTATNLVPGDTNRGEYIDNGLDVFVYDRNTGQLERVSLTWNDQQIDGNSVGHITPDGHHVVFYTDGQNIVPNETVPTGASALYIRPWKTGGNERISRATDGGYPNDLIYGFSSSFDGRYVAYSSDASNLVVGDTNGVRDIFLYDRVTKITTLISKSTSGGPADGLSNPVHISSDGRYITYRSFASNLVSPATDGQSHVYLYDRVTAKTELISVSSNGVRGNGRSRDGSVCDGGRFVSFTSEATNLVDIPHNGHRQIYVRDRERGVTFLATQAHTGGMATGRAHRSILSADCSTIGMSTDAEDMIPGDNNGERDLFVSQLYYPADLSHSLLIRTSPAASGEIVTYQLDVQNLGTDPVDGTVIIPIPPLCTYQSGSATGGAVYNATDNQLEWNGSVSGEDKATFTFAVQIDSGVTAPTLINLTAQVSGDGATHNVTAPVMLNGMPGFLPVIAR